MFTESQRRAWDYIRSAVDQGIKPTAALKQYRAGGGSIRTQDWYRAYKSYKDYGDTWQRLERYSPTETIPTEFWAPAPRNFQRKYVAEVEVAIRYTSNGKLERVYRYIESDYKMSQLEIINALTEMGTGYTPEESWTVDYIYGYKFYTTEQ